MLIHTSADKALTTYYFLSTPPRGRHQYHIHYSVTQCLPTYRFTYFPKVYSSAVWAKCFISRSETSDMPECLIDTVRYKSSTTSHALLIEYISRASRGACSLPTIRRTPCHTAHLEVSIRLV